MKFIHAADLHIDSPLRGLEAYEGAPAERIRGATRDSLANLVTLALDESVAFVILAGDLFDGEWKDMQTGLWTANQFRRLRDADIQVYLIRGNHDADSKVRKSIAWPENVHEFSTRQAETIALEEHGVALHGQGFADRKVSHDLAAAYPEAVTDCLNIGVLHTSLDGDGRDHAVYAPTRLEKLVAKGYDYWALGHVHARQTFSEAPYVAFSGNTQGRHVKETGLKGCLLATVEDDRLKNVEFRPTDVLRWHVAEVTLRDKDHADDLIAAAETKLRTCLDQSEGRFAAVRVVVRGRTAAHRTLMSAAGREQAIAEIRNLAADCDGEIWVEKVLLETVPPIDLERLRGGSDLMGDLLRSIDEAAADEDKLADLHRELEPLAIKAAAELDEAGIELNDVAQLRRWLRQAEGLLVAQLAEVEG